VFIRPSFKTSIPFLFKLNSFFSHSTLSFRFAIVFFARYSASVREHPFPRAYVGDGLFLTIFRRTDFFGHAPRVSVEEVPYRLLVPLFFPVVSRHHLAYVALQLLPPNTRSPHSRFFLYFCFCLVPSLLTVFLSSGQAPTIAHARAF